MTRIVLDASAALNVVMRTTQAVPIMDTLIGADAVLAPRLFGSEAANALWKYVKAGDISRDIAVSRLAEAMALVDSLESDEEIVTEALDAAIIQQHPVYDLLYVVLARRYSAKLVTMDRRLSHLATVFIGMPVSSWLGKKFLARAGG